jgi:hypothetical protein
MSHKQAKRARQPGATDDIAFTKLAAPKNIGRIPKRLRCAVGHFAKKWKVIKEPK